MQFGMMYLFSEFGGKPQAQVFKEFMEEVDLAEELGFDSVWLPEHHFTEFGMLGDTLTMAAALATRTERIKIGTAVVLLPLANPVRAGRAGRLSE
jgi:alkanesulfonate monooxygenase SsuD/methylene tetrahydromethanopterin reductase-like flavin-dependent oxidoreductase (luciferase family)